MIEELKDLFKKEFQYSHLAGILQQLQNITSIFQPQFLKDDSAKNEAIDMLCKILQSHKDSPCSKDGNNATC